ncbi:MAG: zinc ribbon domain-containing protein [Gemmatimonadales bacterium]
MALEALAALVVGLVALGFVLAPVLWPHEATPELPEPVDPEETRRGIALAALREIEFDQATGKLSEADYQLLHQRYSAEALVALRAEAEAGGNADALEARIAAKVRALRSPSTVSCPDCGPRPEPDALVCSSCGLVLGGESACDRCGARLPPESRFCAGCGSPVAA